jgi:hypothetical protein
MNTLGSDQNFASFSQILLALSPDEAQFVRFSLIGGQVIVEGSVPSYEAKRKIDNVAAELGVPIENCLRIIPGASQIQIRPSDPQSSLPALPA